MAWMIYYEVKMLQTWAHKYFLILTMMTTMLASQKILGAPIFIAFLPLITITQAISGLNPNMAWMIY